MSFDTKYRPIKYSDVLGQESTIKILKRIVGSGKGFQQSYLFSGPYGSGKTTIARILARALLCSKQSGGEPCDTCDSCVEILDRGYSECLVEVDAATNSGKESIKQMIESLSYSTFSGKNRLWILDECHMLSRSASDSLLKILEDTSYGTQDRKMVCIFCTTELGKMKETIGSRCGPVFSIKSVCGDDVVRRLGEICKLESIEYDDWALRYIYERTSGHVRDSIKMLEMISVYGSVTEGVIKNNPGLDIHDVCLSIYENLYGDAVDIVGDVLNYVSPSQLYDSLSEIGLNCFRIYSGMKYNSFRDTGRMREIGRMHGDSLLGLVSLWSSRPKGLSKNMVMCDILGLKFNKNIDKKNSVWDNKNNNNHVGGIVCSSLSKEDMVKFIAGGVGIGWSVLK